MSRWLEGKTVAVGLSGGIACYKAADVVRLLRTGGARVRVIMTRHAQEFITPLTLQTLAGEPVSTELFDLTQESEIGHIRLADTADAVVVAPATANLIGKLAHGLGDDLLTTVLLAKTRADVRIRVPSATCSASASGDLSGKPAPARERRPAPSVGQQRVAGEGRAAPPPSSRATSGELAHALPGAHVTSAIRVGPRRIVFVPHWISCGRSLNFGKRVIMASSARLASSRASCAPRQKRIP